MLASTGTIMIKGCASLSTFAIVAVGLPITTANRSVLSSAYAALVGDADTL